MSKRTERDDPLESEEVDPLDAFMLEVEKEVKSQQVQPKKVKLKEVDRCDEAIDPAADFLEIRKAKGVSSSVLATMTTSSRYDSDDEVYAAAKAADDGLEAEYDSDDQLIITKREIGLLPPVDHDKVDYEEFTKDFYEPCDTIKKRSWEEVKRMRETSGIRISGYDVPSPIESFFHCGFDMRLLSVIKKQKFEKPTPIQMQTLPVALSGRDTVGLAKTGSGKTAAYLLPLCIHVMAASALEKGEGPVAIVMAPTRELCEQIHKQARIFGKPYSLRVAACFGGLRKYDQIKALKSGCDVAVATPGRLIDLLKAKACTLGKTTFVVLDEADRMLDIGLEKQVRSIIGQIRPDRQTMLFSATMPRKVERLAGDILVNPVRISVGRVGSVNEDIRQSAQVVQSDVDKYAWLGRQMASFVDSGEVLIFCNQKQRVEELADHLRQNGFRAAGIHGDMDQHSRMEILQKFRDGVHHVLIATDVAARGLDIPSIKTVINFDCAKNSDGHTHRVGRTGRAGDKEGVAYSLITPEQSKQAAYLVNSLAASGQEVSQELYEIAMKDSWFAKRGKKGRFGGGNRQVGGSGLGFKESNPGFGVDGLLDFAQSHTRSGSEWQATQQSMLRSTEGSGSFVSSGIQGGDQKLKATIIAPKRPSKTSLPPPPIPVTQQPLRPPRPSSKPRHFQNTSGPEFQKAFAAAQEIAARFGGTVSKGDSKQ